MRFWHLSVLAVCAASMVACTRPSRIAGKSVTEASPEARIQQIPPADPQKYAGSRDTKTWRNPYLIVKKDGIWLLDLGNNEEHLLKPDQVLDSLAALPASAWPYGRVVAVQEIGIGGSDEDRIALRKNRAILAGTLEGAKVLINWLPSS
jgi:hypothetical protein